MSKTSTDNRIFQSSGTLVETPITSIFDINTNKFIYLTNECCLGIQWK